MGDNEIVSEKTFTSTEVATICQRLSSYFSASMTDAGFTEDQVAEVEQGVMMRQLKDILGITGDDNFI